MFVSLFLHFGGVKRVAWLIFLWSYSWFLLWKPGEVFHCDSGASQQRHSPFNPMLEQYLLLHADCKCCLMRPPFISRRCLYELSHHIRPGGRPFLCLPAGHGLTGGRKRDQLFPAGVQKMPPGDTSDCCWPAASGKRREMENKPQIQTKRCISSCTDQVHRLMCSQQTTVSIIPCMNTYAVMYLFVMTVALDSVWSLLSQSLTSVHFDLFKHLTCDFCLKTLSYIFFVDF